MDRKAAAVGSIVSVGQIVAIGKAAIGMFEGEPDSVRAAMEAGDNIGFALHPAGVVRSSAKRGVKERLMRLAEAAYVDDNSLLTGNGEFAHAQVLEQDDVLEQLQPRIGGLREAKAHVPREPSEIGRGCREG